CGTSQEVDDQRIAADRPVRLGMELNAEDRLAAMRDGHHDPLLGLGIDVEVVGERGAVDDEGVVARRAHRLRTTGEETAPSVAHICAFAVDRHRTAHDFAPVRLADDLVPEADAEEGYGVVGANQIDDSPRARRRAGTGREHKGARPLRHERRRLEGVVAHDAHALPGQTLDLLYEVVGEGIVVVDDGNHGVLPWRGQSGATPSPGTNYREREDLRRAKDTSGLRCGRARSPEVSAS